MSPTPMNQQRPLSGGGSRRNMDACVVTSPSWRQKFSSKKKIFVSICGVKCMKHGPWRNFSGYSREMYTFSLENRILTVLVALATCSEFLFKHCMFLPKTAPFHKNFFLPEEKLLHACAKYFSRVFAKNL